MSKYEKDYDYDDDIISQMKHKKYYEQNKLCAGCGEFMRKDEMLDLAHILPQRKHVKAKWGVEIVHHELNMKLTHHNDDCNNAVELSPEKTELVNKHIEQIKDALKYE